MCHLLERVPENRLVRLRPQWRSVQRELCLELALSSVMKLTAILGLVKATRCTRHFSMSDGKCSTSCFEEPDLRRMVPRRLPFTWSTSRRIRDCAQVVKYRAMTEMPLPPTSKGIQRSKLRTLARAEFAREPQRYSQASSERPHAQCIAFCISVKE